MVLQPIEIESVDIVHSTRRHCPLNSITLSFALGTDVTVNTIFSLPMLCDLDAIISLILPSNLMHSRALNADFLITHDAATFGLPSGCTFDPTSASRNNAGSLGLGPPAAAPDHAAAAPTASALAIAQDDLSLGFLQHTVHPTT